MPRELESRELLDAGPVNPLGDHDFGVFADADIAPENPARPRQRTPSPARYTLVLMRVHQWMMRED
jgi:hypothetical protein